MKFRRRSPLFLSMVFAVTAVTLPSLIWTAGFLSWRLRIRTGLADLQQQSKALPSQMSYTPRLVQAGSRAIPDLLRESRDALSRQDRYFVLVLCWELSETFDEAALGGDPQGPRIRVLGHLASDSPLGLLQEKIETFEARWEAQRQDYPPSWRWWEGHRRGK